ncbi:hypothetical protein [Geobacter sp. SVR]|uniref:hypothetical protein n=1 Tax=Geobacter sp. SVR TaxID=2495594 RepID=UPI00143F04F1|nr:hypothetical protein [Geobacter sp. SVR]BCS53132.1 hypothetical protein GSVR_14400 [Geobacter sp. SVR]GCF84517.1 hypothetical protein GSbR_11170 [Geobacter sp. SVR]
METRSLLGINPSRQYLLGKLIDYRERLKRYKSAEAAPGPERAQVLASCEAYLLDIEKALTAPGPFWRKETFTAWHLFHRFDETLFLLMERAELKAQGWELIQGLKNSSLPAQSCAEWTVKLQDSLKKLEGTPAPEEVREAAFMINSATYVHNDFADNLFWDIWCKKFIALIHVICLVVLLAAFIWCCHGSGIVLTFCSVLLLGAIGGLGSGILTFQPVSMAYGHFWVTTLYHALVRPVQGAMAALMAFWLIQSGYLIRIDPPLASCTAIVSSCTNIQGELPVIGHLPSGVVPAFSLCSSAKQPVKETASFINLTATCGMQIYLYLLVLLVAGFSGDKVLKTVSDRMMNQLFNDAEKTKEGGK